METIFEPVSLETIETYMKLGIQSYNEHYLHLWEDQIATYIIVSFTKEVVLKELNDPNCLNYIIQHNGSNVGILKMKLHQSWGNWSSKEALYLHRIYLLKEATGKNIGKRILDFAHNLGEESQKKVIWLEAMKKGSAKNFYTKNGYNIVGESMVDLPGVLDKEKEMWVMAKLL